MKSGLAAEIDRGPRGPKVGAFFDFDGTVIDGNSLQPFVEDGLRRRRLSPPTLVRGALAVLDTRFRGGDVAGLVRVGARACQGWPEEELVALGARLFRKKISGMIRPQARALIRAHQRQGHTVILASSASRYQLEPFASDLGVEDVLCTRFETADGRLTGGIDGPVLRGEEKARAVRSFAVAHGIELEESWGYGDGDEDIPFLGAVGRPRPVNPGRRLAALAAERGWPVLHLAGRGGLDPVALVRTGMGVAGLGTAAAAAVGVGVLNRSRREATNLMASAGVDLTLALAGVHLRVVGEEHLWSVRPAVFIFNHQSALDALIVPNLARRDVTGVAKREAAHDPRFMFLGALAGVAYVDRANHTQAVSALDHVVQRIQEGVSIVIAPEGTRSATDSVGRFKKGAFRMAMQAGVPIVPVVIRNTGELMWRGSALLRPGTVDITVLPPIDVSGWTHDDLEARVGAVRAQFVDTLADWPG